MAGRGVAKADRGRLGRTLEGEGGRWKARADAGRLGRMEEGLADATRMG